MTENSRSIGGLWLLQYVVVDIIVEAPHLVLLYRLYAFPIFSAVKMRSVAMAVQNLLNMTDSLLAQYSFASVEIIKLCRKNCKLKIIWHAYMIA